ncbi:MAG: hypothetical protein ABEL97_11285 [Salinibacter sp.]
MPKASKRRSDPSRSALIFESTNYLWFAGSAFLIAVGFVAMYLEGTFLGFISLNVSPILILTGYAALIYGILRRSEEASGTDEEDR